MSHESYPGSCLRIKSLRSRVLSRVLDPGFGILSDGPGSGFLCEGRKSVVVPEGTGSVVLHKGLGYGFLF